MGLCDKWLVACLYCFIFSSIDCGRLSDYLFLQRQLLHLLRARQFTHEDYRPPPGVTMPYYDVINNHTDSTHWWRYGQSVSKGYVMKSTHPALSKKNSQPVIYSDILLNNPPYVHTSKYYNSVDSSVNKRRTLTRIDAHIEILLVIDYSIYMKYLRANHHQEDIAKQKIRQYYGILIAMANERYSTISDSSIKVQLRIRDILIAERRRHVAWLESISRWSHSRNDVFVNASRALKRFQMWLRRNRSLPNYDHAIIFTNYILISKKRQQVDGLAYIGTMCKVSTGKSASIIQDAGDFQAAGVIAHELGHSLGATHDGDRGNRECPAGLNHVMAPQNSHDPSQTGNVFYFSSCSIRQMKTFLLSGRSRCLRNAPTKAKAFIHNLEENPPGLLYDPDSQCAEAFGATSTFCDQDTTRSVICSRLWCLSPDNPLKCRSDNRLMALPGTPCGYGKHCRLGACVNDTHTRSEPHRENCPKGDRMPHYFCSKILNAAPQLCSRLKYKDYCCESCSDLLDLHRQSMTFVT